MSTYLPNNTVLLVGASRGLGFAMVEECLKRSYKVIATARTSSADKLQLAQNFLNHLKFKLLIL